MYVDVAQFGYDGDGDQQQDQTPEIGTPYLGGNSAMMGVNQSHEPAPGFGKQDAGDADQFFGVRRTNQASFDRISEQQAEE